MKFAFGWLVSAVLLAATQLPAQASLLRAEFEMTLHPQPGSPYEAVVGKVTGAVTFGTETEPFSSPVLTQASMGTFVGLPYGLEWTLEMTGETRRADNVSVIVGRGISHGIEVNVASMRAVSGDQTFWLDVYVPLVFLDAPLPVPLLSLEFFSLPMIQTRFAVSDKSSPYAWISSTGRAIEVSSVPEPTTGALALGGLGVVYLAIGRRARLRAAGSRR